MILPTVPVLCAALAAFGTTFPAVSVAQDQGTSFEECQRGPLGPSDLGEFIQLNGRAEVVSSHARTGAQCLRLFGGEESGCELRLEGKTKPQTELSFWAERWTSRGPFGFTVEGRSEGVWSEVYDGSRELRVGARFLSEVRVVLGTPVDALRFRCTAPEQTGVLIDDIEVLAPRPIALESVTVTRPVLPVLIGNPWNPVARIDVTASGTMGELQLSDVAVDLAGTTDLESLANLALFVGPAKLPHGDPRGFFGEAERFGGVLPITEGPLQVKGELALGRGTTHLWVCVQLSDQADLDGGVRASVPSVTLDGAEHRPTDQAGARLQRMGVALRSKGDDGSQAFRIPGLVTSNNGTLIAVYDVRWAGWVDLPGHIDVGMMRSEDGGRTWGPQQIIMDMGEGGGPDARGDGIGDPAVLVDRTTGTIFVVATWSHGNRAWRGSGPGLTPDETGQLMIVESRDDGRTWSQPRNLTAGTKKPEWCYLLQGPGRGITTHDGTLVFPAQYQDTPEKKRMPHSTVMVSDDHGKTWRVGPGAKPNTTEAAVVELGDGVLMLNMRDNRGGSRSVYTAGVPYQSWKAHSTTRGALIEPVCMASLIHVGRELNGKADGRLVFSNPHVAKAPRRHMALQASSDFGQTWSKGAVMLDEGTSAGYSCLTMVDEDTVGILYEGSRAHMTFQRVPLRELFPGAGK